MFRQFYANRKFGKRFGRALKQAKNESQVHVRNNMITNIVLKIFFLHGNYITQSQ